MIDLALDIYPRFEAIPWFSTAGHNDPPQYDFPVTFVVTRIEALGAFGSDLWKDAKTEAQGDLTEYLSKHHADSYGGYWNNLARESRAYVAQAAGAKLARALDESGLPADMLQPILLDMNRAALETTYRRKFRKVPVFFDKLVRIYESGRLPCGWIGDMNQWPLGRLAAF